MDKLRLTLASDTDPRVRCGAFAVAKDAEREEDSAMHDLELAEDRMKRLNQKIAARAEREIQNGDTKKGQAELEKVHRSHVTPFTS